MTFKPEEHIINMRGKDYLPVAARVAWFTSTNEGGSIQTTIVSTEPIVVQAIVSLNGQVMSTGHAGADAGGKNVVWSGREIEKAETAAIGRALAHAGYGALQMGDDEGEHLADAPVTKKNSKAPKPTAKKRAKSAQPATNGTPKTVNGGVWPNEHHITALINDEQAGNDFQASGMLRKSELISPTTASPTVVAWGRKYRSTREGGASGDESAKAADNALADHMAAETN